MEPVDPSSSTPSPTPAPAGGAPSTSASLPEPSTMSPEAIAAEIVALRAGLAGEKFDVVGPARRDAVSRLGALYTQRDTQAKPRASTPPSPTETPLPDLPAGRTWTAQEKALVRELSTVAPGLGLETSEITGLVKYCAEQMDADPPDPAAAAAELKPTWGQDFDKRMSAAKHAYTLLPPMVRAWIEEYEFASDPKIVMWLARAGASRLGPEMEAQRMRRDPKSPLNDAMHPDHQKALGHHEHLLRQARETTPGV